MRSLGTRSPGNQNGGPKRVKTKILANLDYPDINNALFHTLNVAKSINPHFYGYSCCNSAGTLEMYRTQNQPISHLPVCFSSVLCHFQDRCANTRNQICTRTATFGMYVKQKYECVMQVFRGSITFQLEFQNEEGYQRYMDDFHNGTLKQEIIDFFKDCYKDFGLDPDDLEFSVSVEDASGNPEDNNNLSFSDRNLTRGNGNTAHEEQHADGTVQLHTKATEKILSGEADESKFAEELRGSGDSGMLSSSKPVSSELASSHKVPKAMNQSAEETCGTSAGTSSAQSVLGNNYTVGDITANEGMVAFGNSGSVQCEIGKRERPTTDDESQKTKKRVKVDFQASSAEFRKEREESLRGKEMNNFYSHWYRSVGHLLCGGKAGTAFRVGDRYLMTAYHIIKDALDWYVNTIIAKAQSDPNRVNSCTQLLENLQVRNCGSDVEMSIENGIKEWVEKSVDNINFSSLLEIMGATGFSLAKVQASKEITQNRMSVVFGRLREQEDILPYPLKLDIPFYSKSDDIAVLEVDWTNLPKPFNLHRSNTPPKSVHIIGYPASHNSEQIIDPNCPVISLAEAQSICQRAVDWWKEKYPGENVEDFRKAYNSAFTGIGKVVFHCSESTAHGASGSPGLINMHEEKPVVSLMLQEGLPSFVYQQQHQELLKTVPKQFLVERGISMSRVYEILSNKPHLQTLRNEIFHT